MMYACVQKQVQNHLDFVNTHLDMIFDITGLGNLEGSELEAVLALEEEIKQASQRVTPRTLQGPGWQNYPMTPVASSFIKGAGAYKGKLLLEFHFDPGKIWGYDVLGQGTEFFEELMLSGSKGGWVWDRILGKPSQFGMAKGKFFAYKGANGEQKFATTPGAEFVHHFGRPAEFTYNPVGYLNNSEEWYNVRAEEGKIWKESLVDPAQSRNPIEQSKLRAMQRNTAFTELQELLQRRRAIEEVRPLIETEQRREVLGEITKLIKPHLTQKDFLEILENILNSQMTFIPIMSPVIDLVEDYKVKGYYANRGKPPVRTWIRRHTREEGTTIKGKLRLTSKKVQEAHKKSRERKREEEPKWKKGDIGYLGDGTEFEIFGVRDDGKLVIHNNQMGTFIIEAEAALKERPSKETTFEFIDKVAQERIDKRQEEYIEQVDDSIRAFTEAIVKSKDKISEWKNQIKKADPETGMFWEDIPGGGSEGTHAEILERMIEMEKRNLKDWQESLLQNQTIKELDLPFKFVFEDHKLNFSNRSKFMQSNKEWLKEVKRQYLMLPARFRDIATPHIKLIDKCKTWRGQNSNSYGGTYGHFGNRLRIASNPKIRAWFKDSVVAHEMGHHVHHELIDKDPELWKEFETIYDENFHRFIKYGDRQLLTQSGLSPVEFVKRKAFEFFANVFAEYYTGMVTGGRNTRVRWAVEAGKIPKSALKEKGYLNSYPKAKIYIENLFGKSGFIEAK